MKNKNIALCIALAFASCRSETEKQIIGKWQAAELKECEDVVPIQTELVNIEFNSNGKYTFNSTLNIKEQGSFRINKQYLFTLDKLRKNATEKAVLIKQLSTDTLVLEMNYKGKDQWLTLIREGANERATQKQEEESKKAAFLAATGTPIIPAAVNTDSIQKIETIKKAEIEKSIADQKVKKEQEANKKEVESEKKVTKKSESKPSVALSYKEREAKRKREEQKEKEKRDSKAAQFRKDYAKREAQRREEERKK